ncbi:MAG: biopolymer transporter ExbD [Flavobacteriales bacterium]|nr:biopolymer transporter ExbD [Flavobacteriales bacterium]
MKRTVPQIAASSMADIAFLLLIFWLLSSTLNGDQGIKRFLPPFSDSPSQADPTNDRNALVVLSNAFDQLLVDGEELDVSELRTRCVEFIVANGDGVTSPVLAPIEGVPVREMVNHQVIGEKRTNYQLRLNQGDISQATFNGAMEKLDRWEAAVEELGRFSALPGSAVISVDCDRATSYDLYIAIQNELEAAIREQRDRIASERFEMTYTEIEAEWKRQPENEALGRQVIAIREVYPYIISEAQTMAEGTP